MQEVDNIFLKIVRKEIKSDIVYENNDVLAFKDIKPVAPIHILVVPKKPYSNFIDFVYNGSDSEVVNYFKSIKDITELLNLKEGSFRMISNNGEYSGQTVMYFHTHIIGGKRLIELVQ